MGSAKEVRCEVMDEVEALELLLRAGGCAELLEAPPPPAAVEAVKAARFCASTVSAGMLRMHVQDEQRMLVCGSSAAYRVCQACGRLPLALSIAGGIISELADTWQTELVPELERELDSGEESVEERVVNASLRVMPASVRQGAEDMCALFAIFPEDAIVPTAAVDVLAPLIGDLLQSGSFKRKTRKLLQQLLTANLLRGSIQHGTVMHDLVRDCMLRKAEAAREGGLRAMQREAIPLLLAAFDANENKEVMGYVSSSLHWHVREAQQPGVAVDADALLMQAISASAER